MMISTKGRYALRMMIDIAEHGADGLVSVKEVSARQGISVKYMEQIVSTLTRAGLLRSGRGSGGGYQLTKAPAQYTAGEILRAIEGKLAPVACLADETNRCGRKAYCKALGFWEGLYKTIDDYVDSVRLEDLLSSASGDGGPGYSI